MIYRDIPYSQISIIKELWERNRKYHENLSDSFGFLYSDLMFEDRMIPFSLFDNVNIKITVSENTENNEILGYCISTIKGNEGETQSLHVSNDVRRLGIGRHLMNIHIEWMRSKGCKNIIITVAFENKNTIDFYRCLGFKENTIEMRLT